MCVCTSQLLQSFICQWTLRLFPCLGYYISSLFNDGHYNRLAWKIPWTEEPDRLQSMGSLRVGHD